MAKVTIADERLNPGNVCVVSGERHVCTVAGQIGPIELPPGEHRYCIDDRRNGSVTVREPVSLPAQVSLESRIAALEARVRALEALEGRAEPDPVPDAVPEALQKFRVEGETNAALRRRLKQMIFDLHSRREAARQGIGTFSDEDYDFLRFLEGQDWLGG